MSVSVAASLHPRRCRAHSMCAPPRTPVGRPRALPPAHAHPAVGMFRLHESALALQQRCTAAAVSHSAPSAEAGPSACRPSKAAYIEAKHLLAGPGSRCSAKVLREEQYCRWAAVLARLRYALCKAYLPDAGHAHFFEGILGCVARFRGATFLPALIDNAHRRARQATRGLTQCRWQCILI